jgi:hypothetical protein
LKHREISLAQAPGIDVDRSIERLKHPDQWLAAKTNADSPRPQLSLRHEDLLADPALRFRRILAVANLPLDDTRLASAVASCRIGRLQALSAAQRARIEATHADTLQRLGDRV